MKTYAILTQDEIQEYRNQLKNMEKQSSCFEWCEPGSWSRFDVTNHCGRQIYNSYTNEELLDFIKEAYVKLKHLPTQKEIFCVYRAYIRHRFGNWPRALQAAGLKQGGKNTCINS